MVLQGTVCAEICPSIFPVTIWLADQKLAACAMLCLAWWETVHRLGSTGHLPLWNSWWIDRSGTSHADNTVCSLLFLALILSLNSWLGNLNCWWRALFCMSSYFVSLLITPPVVKLAMSFTVLAISRVMLLSLVAGPSELFCPVALFSGGAPASEGTSSLLLLLFRIK